MITDVSDQHHHHPEDFVTARRRMITDVPDHRSCHRMITDVLDHRSRRRMTTDVLDHHHHRPQDFVMARVRIDRHLRSSVMITDSRFIMARTEVRRYHSENFLQWEWEEVRNNHRLISEMVLALARRKWTEVVARHSIHATEIETARHSTNATTEEARRRTVTEEEEDLGRLTMIAARHQTVIEGEDLGRSTVEVEVQVEGHSIINVAHRMDRHSMNDPHHRTIIIHEVRITMNEMREEVHHHRLRDITMKEATVEGRRLMTEVGVVEVEARRRSMTVIEDRTMIEVHQMEIDHRSVTVDHLTETEVEEVRRLMTDQDRRAMIETFMEEVALAEAEVAQTMAVTSEDAVEDMARITSEVQADAEAVMMVIGKVVLLVLLWYPTLSDGMKICNIQSAMV